jgi:RHS repeat-associated protein
MDLDPGLGTGLPSFGNVIKQLDYDWGQGVPGALLRETDTVYRWQQADAAGNKPYLAAHLPDLPASTVIVSPASAANIKSNCPVTPTTTANCLAETDYAYDESGYLTPANINTQHVALPNGIRGNPTTVSHWLNTGSTISHTNWYDTGEAYQQIDALGHITTHTYDAAYADAYATKTCSPATGSVTHCVTGTYDFNTGVLTSLSNENATTLASGNTKGDAAHTSNYGYDSMFRLTSATAPPDPANGGLNAQTSFNFSALSASPFNVQRTKSITASLTDSATSYFDGLARVYQSQHVLPGGTSTAVTTFDDANSKLIVTNPYFSTADPTYGSTTTLSDALGRATQVIKQDGSISSVTYNVITGAHDAVIGANTLGDCTDSTDEAGKQRRACADGLGRLVQVVEPNPGSSAVTATGSVSISGSEQSATSQPGIAASIHVTIGGSDSIDILTSCTPTCHTRNVADTGTIGFSVNVGGSNVSSSVSYGGTSNPISLAAALYSAFPSNSYVTMSNPNGTASFTLTANAVSASGNSYVFTSQMVTGCIDSENESCGGMGWNMTLSGPNLASTTTSTANFTGGQNASTNPDAGTVTVTLNGTAYQTTYGASDTAGSIATRLAGLITAGSWANASASGGTITLTTKTGGTATNYSLAASYAWNNAIFVNPSFTTSTSGNVLQGGYDAGALDSQPYVTLYQYDALGNLLRVDQKGTAPGDSTQWRTRTFTYDSFSRLLTATNPESGTITYSYDLDGNLLQKTSPAPNQTGTATQTVSYCYDALHRVTGKGYGAQSCPLATPVVTYAYDSGTNAIGHLTSLTDQAGTASYTYDILGRLVAETRTLTGANNTSISKNLSYEYNLDGSLYKLHYPSGNVVMYEPGAAGLTLSAKDSGNNINYVTSATYGPDSALTGFISGYSTSFVGIRNTFSYNKRLQPLAMSATSPSATVFSLNYDFHLGAGDNGNVFGITNNKDINRNQAFTYDLLNRLISAQNAGTNCATTVIGGKSEYWGNSYGYDAWGNLLQKSVTKCGAENLSVTADAHNWIHASGTDYQYDSAGNMTFNATAPTQTYSYDQENRLTGAAGYAYTYDGDGNRVRKSNASTGTLYWYMTPGIVGESDLSGTLTDEYVFFDGERVARKSTNGIFYYFSDHLKTASVITDSAGVIKAESDYYPWGGELQFVANDSNHYKFSGKERDTETGLDYFGARHYSNGLGRFVTPDWAAKAMAVPYAEFSDPQSLNLYSYVRNVPTVRFDEDGHQQGRPPAEAEAEAKRREEKESEAKESSDPLERARDAVEREQAAADVAARDLMENLKNTDPVDENGACPVTPSGGPSISNANASVQPPSLPLYKQGDKTMGILSTPNGSMLLKSGVEGPAKAMPQGSSGFNIVTRTHVEGHAAAAMQQLGLKDATVIINNPQICSSCSSLLPRMLEPGSHLTVVTSSGTSTTFTGVSK